MLCMQSGLVHTLWTVRVGFSQLERRVMMGKVIDVVFQKVGTEGRTYRTSLCYSCYLFW